MSVVLLPPKLSIHLQLDVLKVNLAIDILHVALGHIVLSPLKVMAVSELGQLLPGGETARRGIQLEGNQR